MSTKKHCLAEYCQTSVENISEEGFKKNMFRHQSEVYMIVSWKEALSEFQNYLEENIWDIDFNVLKGQIQIPPHVDSDEFYESLVTVAKESQGAVNPIILSFIPDLEAFTENLAENVLRHDLGDFFALFDYKQNFSETYGFYIYRVK